MLQDFARELQDYERRCAKTKPRARWRQHPEIWGQEQPGGGQTTANPSVALPAHPPLDHGGGGEIYQPYYCSWPPEDHWRERGRQASVGDACQGAPLDIKRQGCRREKAASGRSLGGEAWSLGHIEPPPLPSLLSVGRDPHSAAARPGRPGQGPGPCVHTLPGAHTGTNHLPSSLSSRAPLSTLNPWLPSPSPATAAGSLAGLRGPAVSLGPVGLRESWLTSLTSVSSLLFFFIFLVEPAVFN